MAKFNVIVTVRDDFGMTKQLPAGEIELTYDQIGEELKKEFHETILPQALEKTDIQNTIVNIVENAADALQYSDFDTND